MQLTLSIPAWDDVKCSKCGVFCKWNGGKGWNKRYCPECQREYQRQRYAANADAMRERLRQRYAANADAERERLRQRYAANADAERERLRRWRAANADAEREKDRQYRVANADAVREYYRQYRAANPEAVRKHNRNRRARKANAICEHGKGCFHQAIASLPQRCAAPGCRRRKGLEADHIIPLSGGGLDCRDNLQLLCKSHNSSKGAADPTAWAQRNGRLL